MLIAPATANTLSKMTNGICDNLLIATYLSAKCPVYFAPAMDLDMYIHPSTVTSLDKLQVFWNIHDSLQLVVNWRVDWSGKEGWQNLKILYPLWKMIFCQVCLYMVKKF